MQQTSTMTLLAFSLSFQTKEGVLRIDKSGIAGENAVNGNLFEIENNHE